MESQRFTASPGSELFPLLDGVQPPATTDELVAAAVAAGGSANAIETLRRLEDRRWDRIDEAVAAATSGWGNRDHDRPG